MVTGQAPATLELRNTPGKNTNNPRWYTHISQLTQFMPPPETYKSKIGSQSTLCQVHTGACVSLLAPEKNDYNNILPPKKDYHVYISRSIYHYAYARQTQVNWRKETKKRQEHKGKERKEKKAKKNERRKGNKIKRQKKQEKIR